MRVEEVLVVVEFLDRRLERKEGSINTKEEGNEWLGRKMRIGELRNQRVRRWRTLHE